jgi:hypothetical protein
VLQRREAFSLASLAIIRYFLSRSVLLDAQIIIRGFGDSHWRLSDLLSEGRLAGSMRRISQFYELLQLQPSLKDGHLAYPGDEKKGHEITKGALGMQIQFR